MIPGRPWVGFLKSFSIASHFRHKLVGGGAYRCCMEHSSIADMAGLRALAIQLGLVGVGVFSVAILFSLGGQFIVAPALLPVQWVIARHSDGWVATLFSTLGSLLLLEVVLAGTVLIFGDSMIGVAAGVLLGLGGGLFFYRTSRDRG